MLLVVVAMMLDVAEITFEFEILLGTATLTFDAKIQAGPFIMLDVVAIPLDFEKMWFEMLLGTAVLAFDAEIQADPFIMLDVVAIPLEFEKMWFEMLLGTAALAFVAKIQAVPLMILDVVAIPLEFEKMWFEMLLEVLTMVVVAKIQAAVGMLSKHDHRIEGSHSTVEKDSLIVILLIQFVAGKRTADHGGRKGEGLQHPFLGYFAKK